MKKRKIQVLLETGQEAQPEQIVHVNWTNLANPFLKKNMKEGFQLTLSSKAGISTIVFVPPQYIKGYLMAVDGTSY